MLKVTFGARRLWVLPGYGAQVRTTLDEAVEHFVYDNGKLCEDVARYPYLLSFVYMAAVPHVQSDHQQFIVVHTHDHAIVANAQSPQPRFGMLERL